MKNSHTHPRVSSHDWDRAPHNRWSFQNVRQMLPTAEVWRGRDEVWALPRNPQSLDAVEFSNANGETTTINDWLNDSYTDGFIVLHRGAIVFERYLNGMSERSLHLSQSVSKSIVGSVAGIMVGKALLNPEEQVTYYLPELHSTAWKGATLRHVLDMTSGVRFIEDYEAPDSDIAITDIASGWKPARAGVDAPECVWDQILTLDKTVRPHGELFQYRSIETDVLAHCMERVSGMRLPQLISQELWQPLGCEESACFTVDKAQYALADGGFNATLRDYARFGQMHCEQGKGNNQQIVPGEWIEDIHNADSTLFGSPYTTSAPNGAYRNQFWIEDVRHRAYMARGVFGQLIYVDSDNDFVAVKLSSWPEFLSIDRLQTALSAIHQISHSLDTP